MKAMPYKLAQEIAQIDRLSDAYVKRKYAQLFGQPPAFNAIGEAKAMIAYKLQEDYYGGLCADQRAALMRPFGAPAEANRLLPGVVLRREWHGKTYEVIVRSSRRFEYEGVIYKSLSAVATQITGVHRSGKVFFGVKS